MRVEAPLSDPSSATAWCSCGGDEWLLPHPERDEVARPADLLEAAGGGELRRVAARGHDRRAGAEARQRVGIVVGAHVLAVGVEGEARARALVAQTEAGERRVARAEHGGERHDRGTRAAGM